MEQRPGSGAPGGVGSGDPASTPRRPRVDRWSWRTRGRQARGLDGSRWRPPWRPAVRDSEAGRAGSPLGPCPAPQGLHHQGDCVRRLCSSSAHLSTRAGRGATPLWPLQRGDAVATSQRHVPLAPSATQGLRFMPNLAGFSQKPRTEKRNPFTDEEDKRERLRKLRELQRPGRSPPCSARRLACEAFLSALQRFILASGSPWFCELLAALVRFVTIY